MTTGCGHVREEESTLPKEVLHVDWGSYVVIVHANHVSAEIQFSTLVNDVPGIKR